ncbi:MAG TPA: FtsX-like permease family protein [Gammaproteobacteria bacterium]|nr:FtsX-like permease family protein [Gammaproteobacteria bacterium]
MLDWKETVRAPVAFALFRGLWSDLRYAARRLRRSPWSAAAVGPRYFATVGTPILAGRDFGEQDREGSTPVAIVSRTFAERDWPGKSALGRCIDVVVDMRKMDNVKCYRVIGVAADAKYVRLDEHTRAALFLPLSQDPIPSPRRELLIRTAVPPTEVARSVRAALAELDPNLPYVDVEPLTAQLRSRLEAPRLGASLFSAFGALALVLAAIGLYGLVSYAVEQRRHEIGIRMAFGAEARNVLALVVRQGMLLTLAGLAIGLVCSLGAARLIAHLLHGVGAADPLAFLSAAALFVAVGLLASFIPARRAAALDPAVTLRDE